MISLPAPPDASTSHPRASDIAAADVRYRWAGWLITLLGIGLRIHQYRWDRSLWIDEAAIAVNVIDRSYGGLAGPLEYGQVAPIGFLHLEKTAVLLLGSGEGALRSVPLLAGVISVVLFWLVAKRILPLPAAALSLFLFAISPRSIYYAAEVKQYSSDAAVGLAVMLAVLWADERTLGWRLAAALGAAGFIAAWLSQTAIVFLAAGGVMLAWNRRESLRRDAGPLSAMGAAWLAGFAGAYALARWSVGDGSSVDDWWRAGMLPLPPTSAADLLTWARAFHFMFHDPLGFTVPTLAIAAWLAGCFYLARTARRHVLLLLVVPVLLTLLAAGLGVYPFGGDPNYGGRVLLFLVPPMLLPVGAGMGWLGTSLRLTPVTVGLLVAGGFLIVRMKPALLTPLSPARPHVRSAWVYWPETPRIDMTNFPVGPVMQRLSWKRPPGTPVYAYVTAAPTVKYYAHRYGIPYRDLIAGRELGYDARRIPAEMAPLRRYGRVWVVFAYGWGMAQVPFMEYLDTIGTRADIENEGFLVSAVLYDFDAGPNPPGSTIR